MRRALLALALGIAVAVAVYAGLAWRSGRSSEPTLPVAAPEVPNVPVDQAERRARAASAGELAIASGESVKLDAKALVPGRPVALRLLLAEPSRSDEPLTGHVRARDGRALELRAPLGADRLDARMEIDPSFLTPGTYLVEVKTTELSHLPLRRYVVEVQ